jgi:hypothetical protein
LVSSVVAEDSAAAIGARAWWSRIKGNQGQPKGDARVRPRVTARAVVGVAPV